MASLLVVGFLLGMRHALDADHLAALAALAARNHGVRDAAKQGIAWGIGHTVTLLVFGGLVLIADCLAPVELAATLERVVALTLIVLGADIVRRLAWPRLRVGRRRRAPGRGSGTPLRALLVGLVHGMAGSGALVLLALKAVASPLVGLVYIATFGIGSIAGMAAISLVISVPLRATRHLVAAHDTLQLTIATATMALGLAMLLPEI